MSCDNVDVIKCRVIKCRVIKCHSFFFVGLLNKISFYSRYLGRKRLQDNEEWVEGSKSLVHVSYSYWTLGYLLTRKGAQKLLEQNPLKNLIPVDEYLPILFDQHPE